jgi:RIP homotypic interaction motif
MDPVTLILTALTKGAVSGLQDSAASAVKSAYESLKAQAKKRLAGHPTGELVLTEHEAAPETWDRPLTSALVAVGADHDADLVAAATNLMRLIDEVGSRAGKYAVVDVHDAQGVQVGDNNTQYNTFPASRVARVGMRAESSKVVIGRNRMANQDIGIDVTGSNLDIRDNKIT